VSPDASGYDQGMFGYRFSTESPEARMNWLRIRLLRASGIVRRGLLLLLTGFVLALAGCWEDQASTPTDPPTNPVVPLSLSSVDAGRAEALRILHEQTVQTFVDQPGFGASRLLPLHRPGPYPRMMTVPAGSERAALSCASSALVDYLDPPRERWTVAKLELIGVSRHPEPIVVLDGKPARPDPRQHGMRALDAFEKASLAALKQGSQVEMGSLAGGEIRMVGAIRAQASCLQCHNKERKDDVLGAFTYVLRPATK
jgi:hypothetical protein